MMNIDIRSLFFLFLAGHLFTIFFLTVYVLSQKISPTVIRIFIFAKILLICQLSIYIAYAGTPPSSVAIFTYILFIFGIATEIYCISHADRRFEKRHFLKFNCLLLVVSLVFILMTFFSPEYIRVLLTNIISTFIYLLGGLYLVRRKTKTKMQYISSFFFWIISALFMSRLVWTIFGDKQNGLYTQNLINIALYTFLFLVSFSWAIVLLLIFKEKDEERIEENNVELKKMNLNKDKFFSIISHDLRGPLGNLFKLGELLWIQQDTITKPQRKKILQGIYQSSKQTFLLLDNLLKWANSNSGVIKYEPHQVNLKDIIDENLSIFKSKADSKKIELTSLIQSDLMVHADYNMINTVVRNLISNAMKFTPKSGHIRVLSKKKDGVDLCTVGIIDNGMGMCDKTMSQVMNIDSHISTRGTDDEIGSGLGLKLCKEFIQKNKGDIWIESKEFKGTKIWFTLPVKCA